MALADEVGALGPALEARVREATAAKGVPPLELRRALEAIREDVAAEAARLSEAVEAEGGPPSLEEALDRVAAALDGLADRELKRYLDASRPAAPAKRAGSIFANALATTARHEETKAGASTLKCRVCGAARVAGEAMDSCSYCGASLP